MKGEIVKSTVIVGGLQNPSQQLVGRRTSRQQINDVELNTINQQDLIDIKCSTQQEQNTYPFQIPVDYIPGYNILWTAKQMSTNFKRIKIRVFFPNTMESNQKSVTKGNQKIAKCLKNKQHTSNNP